MTSDALVGMRTDLTTVLAPPLPPPSTRALLKASLSSFSDLEKLRFLTYTVLAPEEVETFVSLSLSSSSSFLLFYSSHLRRRPPSSSPSLTAAAPAPASVPAPPSLASDDASRGAHVR